MLRFRWLLFALLLLSAPLAPAASAQSDDAGSVYSRFGLGTLQATPSAQLQGLGGSGTGLWSYNYPNLDNPASLGYQVVTRVAAGMQFQRLQVEDAQDNASTLRSGSLGAIQFAFPLLTNRLGVGAGFTPYSRVGYRVQTRGQLIVDPVAGDTADYLINYEGSGGLQKISVGGGYRINPTLSVGLTGDLIFGIIEEGRRTTFLDVGFDETNLATTTQYRGVSATLGALFSPSNVLREDDALSLGVSFSLPTTLDAERARTLGESLDRDTLETGIRGDVELPYSLRAGLAYQTDSRWRGVLDVRYEPWSQFSSDLALAGFTPGGTSTLQDRLRLSGGVEVVPAATDLLAPYLQRVAYRVGFYYEDLYASPDNSLNLNTMALTLGFGLPTLFPGTHLDITLEAGTRGTVDDGFVRDRFIGLGAALNIGERWFTQRKLR